MEKNSYKIRHSTNEEHNIWMHQMSENLHNDNPKVGIFWYNPLKEELFGVVKFDPFDKENCSCSNRGYTCKILHKHYWAKEYRRLKYKEKLKNTYPYTGAYEDKPRGRIFFNNIKNIYYIVAGDWIEDHYEAIDIIASEFDFDKEDFEVIIDHHWDVGYGWENL